MDEILLSISFSLIFVVLAIACFLLYGFMFGSIAFGLFCLAIVVVINVIVIKERRNEKDNKIEI